MQEKLKQVKFGASQAMGIGDYSGLVAKIYLGRMEECMKKIESDIHSDIEARFKSLQWFILATISAAVGIIGVLSTMRVGNRAI